MKALNFPVNLEQKRAILHKDGPLLVLAGAGSGKTRVVTLRIVHMLEEGVSPYAILALTFTNKAAQEMRERVMKMTNQHVLISTFHSFGARFLREWIDVLGFSNRFTIYDEDDCYKVIKAVMAEIGMKEKKGDVRIIKNLISEAKNELKPLDEVGSEEIDLSTLNQFEKLFHGYQARLKSAEALDFDDLLYLPLKIMKEHPEVLARVQEKFLYFLVDEYQDTNQVQYELLKMLSGKNKNLFVVGDPDQSIYSWRGANIKNILSFETDFPGAEVVRLEQNYRSTSRILEAANSLIQHNESRYEKNLWSDLGEGAKIKTYTAYHEKEEAAFVAKEIEKLQERGVSLNEMVIFYRTNAQSRPFEDQLLRRFLTYKIIGGLSFYQRKEIKDILAFLKVINLPSDFVSFSRTINLPKRGVGDTTLEKMVEGAHLERLPILQFADALIHNVPLKNPVKLMAKAKTGIEEYLSIIESLKQLYPTVPFAEFIKQVIEKTGYLAYLKEEEPDTVNERKENLDELITKAKEFEELKDPLAPFLEELTLKVDDDKQEEGSEKLSLMTLHNGKGLEFKVAFLVGMEEDLFPHANSKKDPGQIEEERRLCYVGMTRAKELLYLTNCHLRYLWGIERDMRPSRFLREISPEYLEKIQRSYEY